MPTKKSINTTDQTRNSISRWFLANSTVFAILMTAPVLISISAMGCDANPAIQEATQQEQETNFAAAPDAEANELVAGPWHQWRGPNGNGVVIDQTPVTEWSADKNVLWKTQVPGRGHASPIVVGEQIILATADKEAQTQSVISFNLASGEKNWETVVNEGNFNPRIYPTNTHASSTVACDGDRLFVVFNNDSRAQLAALDLKGSLLWEKKAADFIPKRYKFGFGSSPIIHKDLVIVTSECEQDGSMVAFNTASGDEVWRVAREAATSYSTPVVANVGGKQQMILSGAGSTTSYDPNNGKELWSVPGPWQVTCGTAVWNDDTIFTSGGFPTQQTMAIKADGSEEVVWQNKAKCYEQSMLYHDGHIYGLSDRGVCYCWRATDGKEMWTQRMEDKISASPIMANGHIYFTVQSGKTFVIKANPGECEVVAENQLGQIAYATPTVANNNLLFRVGEGADDDVQEWLYCIGK